MYTGPVVSHTYVTSGTFGVSLTVSNTVGSYTVSKPDYIHVVAGEPPPAAPEADFIATPRSGAAPLMVQFTSTVTGTVTGYDWAFGDGGTSILPHPTHTYTDTGDYTVSLRVDGPGGYYTETKAAYIFVGEHVIYLPLVLRNS